MEAIVTIVTLIGSILVVIAVGFGMRVWKMKSNGEKAAFYKLLSSFIWGLC
ncbi:hypothetical protein [Alkalihalobacillus pseudalcaliphilus]|uniref:hypothetical protein n=1 Tax=Alkalihalobacillus pseudalcaliphilus TaxID=79884 RepID=UPI000ABC4F74|nr:hypothetical protein [Alkalihalobacillus pseudalcaliphilus]